MNIADLPTLKNNKMKNLLLALMTLTLLSCNKKEEVKPDEPDPETTLWCQLWDSSTNTYIALDSAKVDLYRVAPYRDGGADYVYRETVYTGKNGKYAAKLGNTNNDYLYVVTSRSYKSTYEAQPHYYKDSVFIHVIDFKGYDTYNYNYLTTDSKTAERHTGYGCTNYYIADPLE